MIKKIFILALFFAISFYLSGLRQIAGAEENIKYDLLIASQESPFKDAVVSAINKNLSGLGYSVKIISLENVLKESVEDYQGIIILDTCWAGQETRLTRMFTKGVKEQDKDKIIILTTARDEKWYSKIKGVDAVTSASKMNNIQPVVEDIISKIKNRIN